jgi:hypothetical protein
MTSSLPDGMSMAQLKELMNNAPEEPSQPVPTPFGGKSQKELCDISAQYLTAAQEDCHHPMVHKVMALTVIRQFIDWHTQCGDNLMSQAPEQAIGWLRDAGKLQAAYEQLAGVCFGEDDFTFDFPEGLTDK